MGAAPLKHGILLDSGIAVHAVTKTLEYIGVDDQGHGRRVGLICFRLAQALGWSDEKCHYILKAGMLHDCGVASIDTHKKLLEEMEWSGAKGHCMRGGSFLGCNALLQEFSEVIKYHHTRWNEFPDDISQEVKELSNLIFLADRIDVAFAKFCQHNPVHHILINTNTIPDSLTPYVGSLFAEHFLDAFFRVSQHDSFWLELRENCLDEIISEILSAYQYKSFLTFDDIEALAEFISQVVDTKSPFTHYHSLRVSDLTYTLSGLMNYDDYQRRLLRISGLLHDVGKLRVPSDIIDKPGRLTPSELAHIHCHSMDSKGAIQCLFPNTPIAKWISEHHEKLDGSGYPYARNADQIDQPTRILTICDIFQALCQKRPYRDSLPVNKVIEIMDEMEAAGQIDSDIYNLVKANHTEFYRIATRKEGERDNDSIKTHQ